MIKKLYLCIYALLAISISIISVFVLISFDQTIINNNDRSSNISISSYADGDTITVTATVYNGLGEVISDSDLVTWSLDWTSEDDVDDYVSSVQSGLSVELTKLQVFTTSMTLTATSISDEEIYASIQVECQNELDYITINSEQYGEGDTITLELDSSVSSLSDLTGYICITNYILDINTGTLITNNTMGAYNAKLVLNEDLVNSYDYTFADVNFTDNTVNIEDVFLAYYNKAADKPTYPIDDILSPMFNDLDYDFELIFSAVVDGYNYSTTIYIDFVSVGASASSVILDSDVIIF